MSYRCNVCMYIFLNTNRNCPYCGNRIYQNSVSDSELIKEGFSYAPTERSHSNDRNNAVGKTSQDIYSNLMASFDQEYSLQNSNPVQNTQIAPPVPSVSDSTSDFLSQLKSSDTQSSISAPVVPKPVISKQSDSLSSIGIDYNDEAYNREMRRLEAQQRRIQRDARRLAISSFIHNTSWHRVFRFAGVLSIIVVLIVAWQMRYAILESVTNFIVSLIPLALAVGIFWALIKSFFKK